MNYHWKDSCRPPNRPQPTFSAAFGKVDSDSAEAKRIMNAKPLHADAEITDARKAIHSRLDHLSKRDELSEKVCCCPRACEIRPLSHAEHTPHVMSALSLRNAIPCVQRLCAGAESDEHEGDCIQVPPVRLPCRESTADMPRARPFTHRAASH